MGKKKRVASSSSSSGKSFVKHAKSMNTLSCSLAVNGRPLGPRSNLQHEYFNPVYGDFLGKKSLHAYGTHINSPTRRETLSVEDSNQYQYSQVLQLEHAIATLTESLDRIIRLSPTYETYLTNIKDKSVGTELLPSFRRYQLKCAAELKTLYSVGKLAMFDELKDYEQEFQRSSDRPVFSSLTEEDIGKLSPPKAGGAEQNVADDVIADDDYIPSVADPMSPAGSSDSSKIGKNGAVEKWPPPMPQLKDPAIKARVFTHRSMINDKLYLSETDMIRAHNERLEFLGDSILNTTMTMIVYNRFPSFNEGRLSQLRMKLINNEILKDWAFLYGLPNMLKTNIEALNSCCDIQNGRMKMFADVFEAYIGGLIEEDPKKNLPKVRKWLAKLAEPVIEVEMRNDLILENSLGVDVNAKKTLYSLIGYAALNLHYYPVHRPTNNAPYALVECRIKNGVVLGTGRGKNVKIAGMRAAQSVLLNKELVDKYAAERAAIPREESVVKETGEPRRKSVIIEKPREN